MLGRREEEEGGGAEEELQSMLRLQVKIMCRSEEICREHFYSISDYSHLFLPPLPPLLCLFVFGINVMTVGLYVDVHMHAD